MENRTDSSTNKNKSAAAVCALILLSGALGLSCGGAKKGITGRGNILNEYYSSQKYASDKSGTFLKETERTVVNKISGNYSNSGDVIIIKEYCKPLNITGYVYSLDSHQTDFFSRSGENSQIVFSNSPSSIILDYYEKIIELTQRDSLKFYKDINDKQTDADDEMCWLYIFRVYKTKNTYQIQRTTFFHPLAFRRSIVAY